MPEDRSASPLLHRYLDAWSLAAPRQLAATPTSTVYHVQTPDGPAVLKLLTPVGVADEDCGPAALRCYAGDGAVRLLAADAGAHLLEYVPGDDLIPLAHTDDGAATRIIGGVLNRLHQRADGIADVQARTLRRWFRELFAYAAEQPHTSIFVRAAARAEALLDHPQAVRVLHGDIHHGNIRYHPVRGWLAIDPKGIIGERTYDTANTFYNPTPAISQDPARISRTADLLAETTGINRARILEFAFVYGCLSAVWSMNDADTGIDDPVVQSTLKVAALIEALL